MFLSPATIIGMVILIVAIYIAKNMDKIVINNSNNDSNNDSK